MFRAEVKKTVSDEYLQKCWGKVKEYELLKMHFATWFEMMWPLVVVTTERLKEKGDSAKRKDESDEESEFDYGDDEDEDSELESQDEETRKIGKRRKSVKDGERTRAALAAERSKRRKRSIEKHGSGNLEE